jgi:hypothetical protein
VAEDINFKAQIKKGNEGELSSEVENKPLSNGEKHPHFSCFPPVFGIKNGIKATNIEVETP